MTRSNQPIKPNQDEQLADFTDRVVKGQMKEVESNVDEELRGLEETTLRLQRAFPPASLDEAGIKQMQVRLNTRIRKEHERAGQSFWKRVWTPNQVRPQFGIAFAAIALVLMLAVLVPSFTSGGTSTTGAALTSPQGVVIGLVLAGLIFLFFWITRRK